MSMTPQPDGMVRVLGFQWTSAAHEVKDFLARNRVPYHWTDLEASAEARAEVEAMGAGMDGLPVVIFPDGSHLFNPTDGEIAEKIGLSVEAEHPFYDLVVVGGGPAGLAAAVYAASEGLRTVIFEREAPGGQAGLSASIENYLGFPEGLSGGDLARRAVAQAQRFGVEVVAAAEVTALRSDGLYRVVRLDDDSELYCHTVLLALGVAWRTLDAPGCHRLVGAGVYYGATAAEASAFRDQDVYLLGGGNSAGQAAMHLSRYARSVTMVALEESLEETMSQYLLDRIAQTPNIRVRSSCTVSQAEGAGRLERLTIQHVGSGDEETVDASGLFVFIGAQPRTEWLNGGIARDDQGYILAGPDLPRGQGEGKWSLDREPFTLETTLPGVFVAGDVRAGSVKRVGAAVGDGSSVVQFLHAYLEQR